MSRNIPIQNNRSWMRARVQYTPECPPIRIPCSSFMNNSRKVDVGSRQNHLLKKISPSFSSKPGLAVLEVICCLMFYNHGSDRVSFLNWSTHSSIVDAVISRNWVVTASSNGALDSASATPFFCPFLYIILNFYPKSLIRKNCCPRVWIVCLSRFRRLR